MRNYDFNNQLASLQSSHISLVRVWTHVFCASMEIHLHGVSYRVNTTFRN